MSQINSSVEIATIVLRLLGADAERTLRAELAENRGSRGWSAAQTTIQSSLNAALAGKTKTEKNVMGDKLSQSSLWRAKKAGPFNEGLAAIVAALPEATVALGGVPEAKGGDQTPVVVGLKFEPEMDKWARQYAVEMYTQKQIEKKGGDYNTISSKAHVQLEEQARKYVEATLEGAIEKFKEDMNVPELLAELGRLSALQTEVWIAERLQGEPACWNLVGADLAFPPNRLQPGEMRVEPPTEWLECQGLAYLSWLRATCREAHRAAVQSRIEAVLSDLDDQQAWFEDGLLYTRKEVYTVMGEGPENYEAYPLTLSENGFFTACERAGEVRWVKPEHAKLLVALQREEGDGCLLLNRQLVEAFGRHPEKGYPRLEFCVSAGGRRDWFVIALQEGALVRRLEALKALLDARLGSLIPDNAWRIDARLAGTKGNGWRLDAARGPGGTIIRTSGTEVSRGRHAPEGHTPFVDKEGTEGAVILWQGYASSSGGGCRASSVVAFLSEGGTLALDSGKSLHFDGQQVIEA